MPFFDRWWRLRILGAVVAAFSTVAFPLRYLQLALPLDRRAGTSTLPDIGLSCGVACGLALAAWLCALTVPRARARNEWRADAIAGLDVVPRQPIRQRSAKARQEFVWRISLADRILAGAALLLGVPCLILSLGLLVSMVFIVVAVPEQPFHLLYRSFGGLCFVFFCVGLCAWTFLTWSIDLFSHTPRITTDSEGIHWRPRWGMPRVIRWEDARLLEVVIYLKPEGRTIEKRERYILYSRDATIKWTNNYFPTVWQNELMRLIEKRTGLLPSTLDQPLLPRRRAHLRL